MVKNIFLGLLIFISACSKQNLKNIEKPATGNISLSNLKKTAWFDNEYRNYKTDNTLIDSINLRDYKITIIGGNWCSDTRLQLPRFIKIIEKAGYDKKTMKIIFVDRKKKCPDCKDSIAKYKVTFIPVFILYNNNGEEKGRITESPSKSLEADILNILRK